MILAAVSSSTSSPATMPPRQRRSAIWRQPASRARLTSGSIRAAASVFPDSSASRRSLACTSLISSKAMPAASSTSIAA